MKIILMRHGKPLLPQARWITAAEMARWVEQYNLAVVAADSVPASNLSLVNAATTIVTSTTPRAVSSAQALGCDTAVADPLFCEAQLPFAAWRFLRLPAVVWVAFFRLLWLGGFSRNADSIQTTKIRAKAAAQTLIALAEQGSVLLVGHGIMNRLIARELVAAGWVGAARHASSYWGVNCYLSAAPSLDS